MTVVAIIGAGPSGLMAAEILANGGVDVTVYDAMPSAGRKFLMAGRGGLNLTHSEPLLTFLDRYGPASPHLVAAIEAFSPSALQGWSEALGQPTFVGSSGRVFPQAFKASPLLRAWLRRLDASGVRLALRHRWSGWSNDGRLMFQTAAGSLTVQAQATVLALGGASWPRLGSNGAWVETLIGRGVAVKPLLPANCGFRVVWSDVFKSRFEGQPLKNISLSVGSRSVRGEAMITQNGIEGGAVYALSRPLRDAIMANGEATIRVALLPDMGVRELVARLEKPKNKQSFSNFLRKTAHLPPVAIGLLQEVTRASGLDLPSTSAEQLATFINAVPITLKGNAPIARAISSAGGLAFDEIDTDFMIRRLPGVFAAGEMLDWEAPTGGYLLQASFATGAAAARGALKWLNR